MKSPKTLLSASLAISLLAAACGGNAAPANSGSAPSPAAKTASASPAVASASAPGQASSSPSAAKPATSGAASSAKPAPSGAPIKIGVLEPLTGTQAAQGKDNRDGLNLYMSQINSTVAGRKVELTFADSEAKADVGLTKAKELVENQGVKMLMGVSATPVCYAVATYVKQAQIPFAITGNCAAQDILTGAKYKSPYLSRFTINNGGGFAPGAEWLYQQGYRKASVWATNFSAGHEFADVFSAAFVSQGGSVVQVQFPAIGTSDFGPLLAQLDPSADVVVMFLIGIDGLRFAQQWANYGGAKKPPLFDTANVTGGENLDTLKDSAVGMYSSNIYTPAIDTPMNQAFLKAWAAKYPGRSVSANGANGYASGQMLEAALKKVNGAIENKQQFLDAIDATNLETVKGPLKLDANHDVVENLYIYQVVKEPSGGYGHKILHTFNATTEFFKWTPDQIARLKVGQDATKWPAMDKAKLDQLLKG